ncbi:hypothetical protein, partial [Mycobacterium innocens]|uniref:hypothetical protein n=1 Tax=Mycobacterium innocens TaxID=2341083 RepID=UPI001ABF920C
VNSFHISSNTLLLVATLFLPSRHKTQLSTPFPLFTSSNFGLDVRNVLYARLSATNPLRTSACRSKAGKPGTTSA